MPPPPCSIEFLKFCSCNLLEITLDQMVQEDKSHMKRTTAHITMSINVWMDCWTQGLVFAKDVIACCRLGSLSMLIRSRFPVQRTLGENNSEHRHRELLFAEQLHILSGCIGLSHMLPIAGRLTKLCIVRSQSSAERLNHFLRVRN